MRKFLAVAVLVFTASSLSAQSKRPATFDDVLNIKAIQGATISPDGRWVIYGVREWVSEQDKMESRTHVWKVATDGNSPARQITFGEKGESQAQFSPDGKFISFVVGARQRGSQVADLRDVDRRRRSVEAHRREGKRDLRIRGRRTDRASRSWRTIRAAPMKKPTSRSATTSACSKATSASRTRGSSTSTRKQATRITEGTQWTVQGAPSWSPDGKQFVFGAATTPMLRDNRRDVYRAPTIGQAEARSKRSAPTGATTARRAGRRTARRSRGSASRTPRRRCPTAPPPAW